MKDEGDIVAVETAATAKLAGDIVRVIEIARAVSHPEGEEGTEPGEKVATLQVAIFLMTSWAAAENHKEKKMVVAQKLQRSKALMEVTKGARKRMEEEGLVVNIQMMRMMLCLEEKRVAIEGAGAGLAVEVMNHMTVEILSKRGRRVRERRKVAMMMTLTVGVNIAEAGAVEKVAGKEEKDRTPEVGPKVTIAAVGIVAREKEKRKVDVEMTMTVEAKVTMETEDDIRREKDAKADTDLEVNQTEAIIRTTMATGTKADAAKKRMELEMITTARDHTQMIEKEVVEKKIVAVEDATHILMNIAMMMAVGEGKIVVDDIDVVIEVAAKMTMITARMAEGEEVRGGIDEDAIAMTALITAATRAIEVEGVDIDEEKIATDAIETTAVRTVIEQVILIDRDIVRVDDAVAAVMMAVLPMTMRAIVLELMMDADGDTEKIAKADAEVAAGPRIVTSTAFLVRTMKVGDVAEKERRKDRDTVVVIEMMIILTMNIQTILAYLTIATTEEGDERNVKTNAGDTGVTRQMKIIPGTSTVTTVDEAGVSGSF